MSAASRMGRILIADRILAERDRQEGFVRSGRFKETCANLDMDEGAKWAVLMEEIGEVGRAQLEGNRAQMLTEMIEVSAVAAAWAESLLAEKAAALAAGSSPTSSTEETGNT